MTKIVYIGHDVIYKETRYHVQDTDVINQVAKIGIPDGNNLVWDTIWFPFEELKSVNNHGTSSK